MCSSITIVKKKISISKEQRSENLLVSVSLSGDSVNEALSLGRRPSRSGAFGTIRPGAEDFGAGVFGLDRFGAGAFGPGASGAGPSGEGRLTGEKRSRLSRYS